MGDKFKFANLINAEGCTPEELKANLGRIQFAFEMLDRLFDIEYSDDYSTQTINIENINKLTATQTVVNNYFDGSEIEYCFDYCTEAAAKYQSPAVFEGSKEAEWTRDHHEHIRRARRRREEAVQIWHQSTTNSGGNPEIGGP